MLTRQNNCVLWQLPGRDLFAPRTQHAFGSRVDRVLNQSASIRLLGLCLLSLMASAGTADEEEVLFSGDFGNKLASPWITIGGTWKVQQGLLKQVEAGLDDPCKVILAVGDPDELSSGIAVTTKLRLDTWQESDQARVGVGLCCDPISGYGLNLAFNRGQL